MHDDKGNYWCEACRKSEDGRRRIDDSITPPDGWFCEEVCSRECMEALGLDVFGRGYAINWPLAATKVFKPWPRPHSDGSEERIIYFIQCGDDGPIKIGVSNNVKDRLMKLQAANPYTLHVIGTFIGVAADEAAMHKRFAPHRLRGEWFKPAQEIYDVIMSIIPWPEVDE